MLKITISGVDELREQFSQIQAALANLGEHIGTVSFDPTKPESIDGAISEIHRMIDDEVAEFSENEIVRGIISEMKEKYIEAIKQKALDAKGSST